MRKILSAEEFFERFDQAFEYEQRMVKTRSEVDKLIAEVGVHDIGADINLTVMALSSSYPILIDQFRPRIESPDFLGALAPGIADHIVEFGHARDSFFRIASIAHQDTVGRSVSLRSLNPDSDDIVSIKDTDRKRRDRGMQAVNGNVSGMFMWNLAPGHGTHLYVAHGGWISANRTAFARVVQVVDGPDGSKKLEPTVDIRFHD